MLLDKGAMLNIVRSQLAVDMNCDPEDFINSGIVFRETDSRKGVWLDEWQTPHLRVVTMGKGIVVRADADILEKVRPILAEKFRDDVFSAPFLFGHSLYYIPDSLRIAELPCPDGFSLKVSEDSEIRELYAFPGFDNAMRYHSEHPRPDVLAMYAVYGDEIAGVAGASRDCETMWQIGIDVKEKYRGCGLASCLVSRLAVMIMQRGIVPFYGTASSNIASQAVAYRSGFAPAWMCNYKHVLDGKSIFHDDVEVKFTTK